MVFTTFNFNHLNALECLNGYYAFLQYFCGVTSITFRIRNIKYINIYSNNFTLYLLISSSKLTLLLFFLH